ncbi:hypothetical protein PanWU01x14_023830 [Parasponia andersonii]|uniref:Uncharacterized protein n=1 Tax=Parasponia andersonii TaxID=3476 RepID=A0A2P5DXM5_PARAD|nr:hypothetical protein PanWU01x14_023830 [Parasponia andersonii]
MGSQGVVERSLGGSGTNSRPSIVHFRRATAARRSFAPSLGNEAVRHFRALAVNSAGRHARLGAAAGATKEAVNGRRERIGEGAGENERETEKSCPPPSPDDALCPAELTAGASRRRTAALPRGRDAKLRLYRRLSVRIPAMKNRETSGIYILSSWLSPGVR